MPSTLSARKKAELKKQAKNLGEVLASLDSVLLTVEEGNSPIVQWICQVTDAVKSLENFIPNYEPEHVEAERLTEEILEVTLALASLDFTKTVRVGFQDSNFNAVAAGLNMLGEELQRSVVSKAYVDNIISSMTDSLIVVNPDCTVRSLNEYARKLLGYEEGEVNGAALEVLFEEVPEFLKSGEQEIASGTLVRQSDVSLLTKDKKAIPMQVNSAIMTDAFGNFNGFVLVARDMREIRSLIEKAEAAADAERRKSAELEKAHEDLEAFNREIQRANDSLEKEVEHRIVAEEKLQQAHDELERKVEERTLALRTTNELLNQEIDERKRAEEEIKASEKKFRYIFENTSVSVWEEEITDALQLLREKQAQGVTDFDQYFKEDPTYVAELLSKVTIFNVNAATLKLFEARDQEELVANLENLFLPTTFQCFQRILLSLLKGDSFFEAECEFLTVKGKKKNLHILINSQHFPDGKCLGLISMIDNSSQRELEDQLRQSQKMEAIGRLAGGVAHDFNNLLTVILNYGQILSEEIGSQPASKKKVDQIVECAERAASLTQQLLAFSRKQVVEPRVIDLNTVVNKMEKMLKRLLGEDIEFVNRTDPAAGKVKADIGQIEQVIMNLAVNSRDAMPKGGKLIIETKNVDISPGYALQHNSVEPGSYVMFAVTDTGEGMTEQVKSKIFDPFFTTKGIGKGTGLGLSTVYGNVKQANGQIWVYSELGIGSTFKIYLPRLPEAEEHPANEQEVQKPIEKGAGTILVVEDEDSVRGVACMLLKRYGFTIIEARNGAEALDLSRKRQEKIDLMLSDVIMPNMNGQVLANQISKERPDMKILFMSGYTDNALEQNGALGGEIQLLQKPFTPRSLVEKVREVMDSAWGEGNANEQAH